MSTTQRLTPEEHQRRRDAYFKFGSDRTAAEALGLGRDQFSRWRRHQGLLPHIASEPRPPRPRSVIKVEQARKRSERIQRVVEHADDILRDYDEVSGYWGPLEIRRFSKAELAKKYDLSEKQIDTVISKGDAAKRRGAVSGAGR